MKNKMLSSGASPNLNTYSAIQALEKTFLTKHDLIASWLERQWHLTQPPIYGSVDLRNAGFKIAPIDMNLFPAGFNNLNPDFLSFSVTAAKEIILQINPATQKILILPEAHTRNIFYWSNIKTLQTILEKGGFSVRLGSLAKETQETQVIRLENGEELLIEPLLRVSNQLSVKGFTPDLILLNNDTSEGIPEILQSLEQKIVPPAELGWSQRLKSAHFQYYAGVADEFCALVEIDPWLIAPLFRHCGAVDFMQQDGLDCVTSHAENLFAEIEKKYTRYHIPHQPFLIVKADAGTYGMAVMTIRQLEDLQSLNRKQRTRMSATKGGQPVRKVIIQEGIYTFETIGESQAVAEPVVYMWGSRVAGGFYRVHSKRGVDENLNAPGMHFEPIAFSAPCHEPGLQGTEESTIKNHFYTYGIIAQLSMLAAAREMQEQLQREVS